MAERGSFVAACAAVLRCRPLCATTPTGQRPTVHCWSCGTGDRRTSTEGTAVHPSTAHDAGTGCHAAVLTVERSLCSLFAIAAHEQHQRMRRTQANRCTQDQRHTRRQVAGTQRWLWLSRIAARITSPRSSETATLLCFVRMRIFESSCEVVQRRRPWKRRRESNWKGGGRVHRRDSSEGRGASGGEGGSDDERTALHIQVCRGVQLQRRYRSALC